jgi:hypothetical protein
MQYIGTKITSDHALQKKKKITRDHGVPSLVSKEKVLISAWGCLSRYSTAELAEAIAGLHEL